MNHTLIYIYEPNGLGTAKNKIAEHGGKIKPTDFAYIKAEEFDTDKYKIDLLILEDQGEWQLKLIRAASHLSWIKTICVCDSLPVFQQLINKLRQTPRLITLDYKIGSKKTTEQLPAIYQQIKRDYEDAAVIAYTNYGRIKADDCFSKDSADDLTEMIRKNRDAVIGKSLIREEDLATILDDRFQVSILQKEVSKGKRKIESLKKEIKNLYNTLPEESGKSYLVGKSVEMRKVYAHLAKLKGTLLRVLLTGENGTGKGAIARAIYEDSPRNDNTLGFCYRNCAAFPNDNLLLSELFGHKKGAFTGADYDKDGVFMQYKNGTIFLDEIGQLSAAAQATLLGILQDGKFSRVGDDINKGDRILVTYARLICATNENLESKVHTKAFREDLYYRIAVKKIEVPPLRERKDDIEELANYIIGNKEIINEVFGRTAGDISFSINKNVLNTLYLYNFSGNVRELENILKVAMANARSENAGHKAFEIKEEHLELDQGNYFTSLRRDDTALSLERRQTAKRRLDAIKSAMQTCKNNGVEISLANVAMQMNIKPNGISNMFASNTKLNAGYLEEFVSILKESNEEYEIILETAKANKKPFKNITPYLFNK